MNIKIQVCGLKRYVIFLLAMFFLLAVKAQPGKMLAEIGYWQEHPEYSFFQETVDDSGNKCIHFKTRGETKSIIGANYPIFLEKKDSSDLTLRIRYKVKDCKCLLLTVNTIGLQANTVSRDTVLLPLSEMWTDARDTIKMKNGFMLEVTIEAEGQTGKPYGDVFVSDYSLSADGHDLRGNVIDASCRDIQPSSILPYKAVMSSSLMDKKILALGETVEGTQTFFDIGTDIIKERVINHRCDLVLFELPLSACLYIDRYVKGDERFDERTISTYLESFARFDIMPFLRWLKEYNFQNGNSVTCLGIDGEAYSILGRLSLYNFLESANINGALDSLCYDVLSYSKPILVDAKLAPGILSEQEVILVQKCIDNMDEHGRSVRMLTANRDDKMAEMMRMLYDMYVDDTSTVTFYGHFLHSSFVVGAYSPFIHNTVNMGCLLKKMYGDDYSCIALSARQGDALYLDMQNGMMCRPIQDAPACSLERVVSETASEDTTFMHTRILSDSDIYKMRCASAIYRDEEFHYSVPRMCLDGMVCVNEAVHVKKDITPFKTRDKMLKAKYYEVLKSVIKKRKK